MLDRSPIAAIGADRCHQRSDRCHQQSDLTIVPRGIRTLSYKIAAPTVTPFSAGASSTVQSSQKFPHPAVPPGAPPSASSSFTPSRWRPCRGGQRRNFPFKECRYACVFFYIFRFSNSIVLIIYFFSGPHRRFILVRRLSPLVCSQEPEEVCKLVWSAKSSVTTRFRISPSGMHVRSSTRRFQFLRCHICQSTIVVAWFVKLRVRWSYICGWCFVVGNKGFGTPRAGFGQADWYYHSEQLASLLKYFFTYTTIIAMKFCHYIPEVSKMMIMCFFAGVIQN